MENAKPKTDPFSIPLFLNNNSNNNTSNPSNTDYNQNNQNSSSSNQNFKTPKKNLVLDLNNFPFRNKVEKPTPNFLIEIIPFENLTEIQQDQNFLEVLKFTVNKLKKKYRSIEINESFAVQKDLYSSIQNLRKFQKFSQKIFEATFNSLIKNLENLINFFPNEKFLILFFTFLQETFSNFYKSEADWFKIFSNQIFYNLLSDDKILSNLAQENLKIFSQKKFYLENFENVFQLFIGQYDNNMIIFMRNFVEKCTPEILNKIDLNNLLNYVDMENLDDDYFLVLRNLFEMILKRLEEFTNRKIILNSLESDNRNSLNDIMNYKVNNLENNGSK